MDGIFCTWRQGCTNRCSLAAGLREKWRGNEEMRRKWRKNEEMERDWLSTFPHSLSISSLFLHFLILSPFPPSLSISYIKMRHILLQNVKYGTFVANVTKISTYALWGNNSGSNLLRGSSAIRAGLDGRSSCAISDEDLLWYDYEHPAGISHDPAGCPCPDHHLATMFFLQCFFIF